MIMREEILGKSKKEEMKMIQRKRFQISNYGGK